MRIRILSLVFACSLLTILPKAASADGFSIQMSATYYVMAENDPDVNRGPHDVITDLVLSHLGPGGLPVANSKYISNGYIRDANSVGEITWWSPSFDSDVAYLGTGSVSAPFFTKEFPPTGNDFQGFLTASFTGTFTLSSSSTLTLTTNSDDDSPALC